MPPQKPLDVGPLDALALFCEIAMVVVLVLTGHGFLEGWRGWAVGGFLAFVAISIWAQWMSPNSIRRLQQPTRVTVQVTLFVTVAMYAAAGGLGLWGVALAVVAIPTFIGLSRIDAS